MAETWRTAGKQNGSGTQEQNNVFVEPGIEGCSQRGNARGDRGNVEGDGSTSNDYCSTAGGYEVASFESCEIQMYQAKECGGHTVIKSAGYCETKKKHGGLVLQDCGSGRRGQRFQFGCILWADNFWIVSENKKGLEGMRDLLGYRHKGMDNAKLGWKDPSKR